jgi:SAM-dependent methyltransferase
LRPTSACGSSAAVGRRQTFCFGVAVERRLAETAFGSLSIGDLEQIGVAEIADGLLHPRCLIRPLNGLLITSDLPSSSNPDVSLEWCRHETLSKLTVRRPAGRAFDLGTGCGVQALLMARHAAHVTAVDINPHAIALARFNAALNGFTNIDVPRRQLFRSRRGRAVRHHRLQSAVCDLARHVVCVS